MLGNGRDDVAIVQERPTIMRRALRIDWLGQTAASFFWIVSVFNYGISSTGDWLRLCAASAWFVLMLRRWFRRLAQNIQMGVLRVAKSASIKTEPRLKMLPKR